MRRAGGKHGREFKKGKDNCYVTIYRDTRDVLVSSYHWRGGKRDINTDVVRVIERFVNDQNMTISAEQEARLRGIPVKRLYYDDMKNDTARHVESLAWFLNMNFTEDQVKSVTRKTSFDAMREKEKSGRMGLIKHPDSSAVLARENDPTRLNGVMTRHGSNGDWMTELNEETQKYCTNYMIQHLDRGLKRHFLHWPLAGSIVAGNNGSLPHAYQGREGLHSDWSTGRS